MKKMMSACLAALCALLLLPPSIIRADEAGRPGDLTALTNTPAITGLLALPQESGPGARGSHVLLVQTALAALGYLPMEEADSIFGPGTIKALSAFQADSGLRVSGRADAETLALLFTPPETLPGQTIMPPWYGEGQGLVPFGATFLIKDVRSGIIFEAVHMMGESHLDAEPLTQADTDLMKQAYGGEWSWDRRPILLNYQGLVIAASMNGMPHGYHAIRDNGMPGHFCIHFAYARGDSSQRVDSDHLQAAFEAAQTGWEDAETDQR